MLTGAYCKCSGSLARLILLPPIQACREMTALEVNFEPKSPTLNATQDCLVGQMFPVTSLTFSCP